MKKFLISVLFLTFLIFACGESEQKENKIISTKEAPGAIGPYSQAIKSGNNLYVSGQIALDAGSGKLIEGGIKEQTHQTIKNIRTILSAAGYDLKDVVQCQVFLANLNDYDEMNNVYVQYFKNQSPARAVVEVKRIPRDALIEIMVVASKQEE